MVWISSGLFLTVVAFTPRNPSTVRGVFNDIEPKEQLAGGLKTVVRGKIVIEGVLDIDMATEMVSSMNIFVGLGYQLEYNLFNLALET